jgi:hypothetical protein
VVKTPKIKTLKTIKKTNLKKVKKNLMPKKVSGKIFVTRKKERVKTINQPSQAIKTTQTPKL